MSCIYKWSGRFGLGVAGSLRRNGYALNAHIDQCLRIGALVLARSYPRIAILTADIHKPVGRERQADIALKQIILAITLIILPVASDEGRSFTVEIGRASCRERVGQYV